MLLLDHNVPRKLKATLTRLELLSKTAVECGWDKLENGDLVAKAIGEKYEAILTRDRRFQISAAASLKDTKNFTIVLLTLPQSDAKNYCAEFEKAHLEFSKRVLCADSTDSCQMGVRQGKWAWKLFTSCSELVLQNFPLILMA